MAIKRNSTRFKVLMNQVESNATNFIFFKNHTRENNITLVSPLWCFGLHYNLFRISSSGGTSLPKKALRLIRLSMDCTETFIMCRNPEMITIMAYMKTFLLKPFNMLPILHNQAILFMS